MITEITPARPLHNTESIPPADTDCVNHGIDCATAVPRYTSYPTADRFVEAFTHHDYLRYLKIRRASGNKPLSLYVHVPYCRALCYYCACNKKVTSHYDVEPFISALDVEMQMVCEQLGSTLVSQMHWGGGTPTFLTADDIQRVFTKITRFFTFTKNAQCAIEIDPRTIDRKKVQMLASLGFRRASLGIQDFDVAVQKKINRIQPVEMVREAVSELRQAGFQSINFDLIAGLPLQTVDSFALTLEHVIALKPERLAMYHYAHLPSRFKAQRLLEASDIPTPVKRQKIFDSAAGKLLEAGYLYIGMDHFALPEDELSVALRNGRLHRNFQGYTTQGDHDLIGLGPSAISKVGACYSQNTRSVRDYIDRLSQGVLPTDRGVELCRDDVLRRAVITAIMCQNQVDKASMEAAHLIDFDEYFIEELQQLSQSRFKDLVVTSTDSITVTEEGRRNALRDIAFVFDQYSRAKQRRQSAASEL